MVDSSLRVSHEFDVKQGQDWSWVCGRLEIFGKLNGCS